MDYQEYLVIAGGVLVVAAFLWIRRDFVFFRWRAQSATGTIVQWMSAREKGVLHFRPVIEYVDHSGDKQSYLADERCEEKPMYPEGTLVTVLYLPGNKDEKRTIYPTTGI